MGTVIGLDDTDSRTSGMCTTYVGARIADALIEAGHSVDDRLLIRLNPAVEHKTRGNGAVAIHTNAPPETALEVASHLVTDLARTAESRTNPGIVVASDGKTPALAALTWKAIRQILTLEFVRTRLAELDVVTWSAGSGRGLIGAAAAIGADAAFSSWTVELLGYRESARRGTPRSIDAASVFHAAECTYPRVWDTVDMVAEEPVCVPNAPGPVLFGLRGESPGAVRTAAAALDHEPLERQAIYRTNQGTDAHLVHSTITAARDGQCIRVPGRVVDAPTRERGGHVRFEIGDAQATMRCVAFAPTGRFRDRVQALNTGDRILACGEVGDGTLKLEKFLLRNPRRHRRAVPRCSACGRQMESAGRTQGYRCRDCDRHASKKRLVAQDRSLTPGWYEVPPVARRHLARPLIRGGFDGPVHPER